MTPAIKTIFSFLGFIYIGAIQADDTQLSYSDQLDEKNFEPLFETSPFQRTINIEDTYSLRAVATYGDISYARVYNNITKKTVTVELEGKVEQGLKLLKITNPDVNEGNPLSFIGDDYLAQVSAQISFAGETAELKYDPAMVNAASRKPPSSSGGDKGGKGGRGGKGGLSSSDRDIYRSLSDKQRDKLHAFMRAQRENSSLPREERFQKVREAMQTLSKGGDITVPGN